VWLDFSIRGSVMAADPGPERWRQLCELASKEPDSKKLLALVEEINRLLETRRNNSSEPQVEKTERGN
jgi:hypothetical protein